MSSLHVTHRILSTLDLIIIGVYFLIVFVIGFYFSLKERTSTDYFLASRNVGWFAIGASLFVSNISTEHFIGLAGSGAASGLAVGHFEWLACLILLILGWVFVPFYLRSNVFTMPEFLERRFNRSCAVYLASISIIAYVFTKISVHLYGDENLTQGPSGSRKQRRDFASANAQSSGGSVGRFRRRLDSPACRCWV
jgi:solute:Na+ symporter, SSS family